MLAASPSPTLRSASNFEPAQSYSSKPQHDLRPQSYQARSTLIQHRKHFPFPSPLQRPQRRPSVRSLDSYSPPPKARRKMVDAATQYSPPKTTTTPESPTKTPVTNIAGLKIDERERTTEQPRASSRAPAEAPTTSASKTSRSSEAASLAPSQTKRQASEDHGEELGGAAAQQKGKKVMDDSPTKKSRPETPAAQIVPQDYEFCDTRDLVVLISSMLMELIRYNDAIPLRDGHLTRFHSRAPPGISVQDYLQRITTHATLPPPILLSMVYYIDRLCALYSAFTITSLTVHRFLIASATVASKGLSDSFWTNKTYARVGGVSVKELALLELEFLTRLEWRIVPKPEILSDYYRSLVKRSETHTFRSEAVT